MTSPFRAIWAVLIWLFALLIPVQFYLAGHGAMEGAHAADKAIIGMKDAWDPHILVGTLMLLISLLALLAILAARAPRRMWAHTAALFIAMVVQYILPLLLDSASTRWIAALHAVNALIVVGLTVDVALRARPYLPIAAARGTATEGQATVVS